MLIQSVRRLVLISKNLKYRKIFFSRLFDEHFYLNRYPDVADSGIDPLLHYCNSGYKEERRPSLLFDTLFYMRTYGADQVFEDPFYHYLEEGWTLGNNPNRYFDTRFYSQRYREEIPDSENPLLHYLRKGWLDGNYPAASFQKGEQRRLISRSDNSSISPLETLLRRDEEIRNTVGEYFDSSWYHDKTPSLPASTLDLWHHYIDYGVYEGKAPLPIFQQEYYRDNNVDFDSMPIDPFLHYRKMEKLNKCRPSEWFDPEFYRAAFPVRNSWSRSLLEHYLQFGVFSSTYIDQRIADLPVKPVISIVVPVFNPKPHVLNNCIRSVLYQAYPHWELCLCDDCSTEPYVYEIINKWQEKDTRIRVVRHEENRGIGAATNSAAGLATGEYIGFLDNDDELSTDCLFHIADSISSTGADMLYSDEDLVGEDGRRFSAFYKPGFNRELLLCHNYITHFLVVARDLFFSVGGCDPALDGAQDYDLVLKLTEKAKLVVHVPEIVYHWRASETSTSINHEQKSYADEAGRKAVEKVLQRTETAGVVEGTDWKYFYRLRRKLNAEIPVSIILFVEDVYDIDLHERILQLTDTAYGMFDIHVIHTSEDKEVQDLLDEMSGEMAQISQWIGSNTLSKAQLLNSVVPKTEGRYLVFLSSEVIPISSGWLNRLMETAQVEGVGCVGGRLHLSDELLQVSRVPDVRSESPLYFRQFLQDCSIHMNGLQWSQEVMATPQELFVVSKKLFSSAGGFRAEYFPSLFYGMDLNFRLRWKGYLNIYQPDCEAEWKNDRMIVREQQKKDEWLSEKQQFQRMWPQQLFNGDPYYHPGCYRERNISDEEFRKWCLGDFCP